MKVDDFSERLRFSSTESVDDAVGRIVRARISGTRSVRRASIADDKTGCDYWVSRPVGADIAVDVKVRSHDYAIDGNDDLALEIWSVCPSADHAGSIGWTRDDSKVTDYVIWFWQDTGRFHVVPFPPLCAAFRRYWRDWAATYPSQRIHSSAGSVDTWAGLVVFVPRATVDATVSRWSAGTVPAWSPPSERGGQGGQAVWE